MSIGMSLEEAMKTIKFQNEYITQLSKEKCALQAKIDSLMLEHCLEEMRQEQIECWEESQVVSTWSADDKKLDSLLNLNHGGRETYGYNKYKKPNQYCYWDNDHQCWAEDASHYRNRLKCLITN